MSILGLAVFNFNGSINEFPQLHEKQPSSGGRQYTGGGTHGQGVMGLPKGLDRPHRRPNRTPFLLLQNTGSGIARELESEIGRANCLFLNVPKERSIDPAPLEKKESNPFFARPLATGVGIRKLQETCIGEIKCHRLAFISDQALALPLDDQRRMAYLARYGDLCARQLVLGPAHHIPPLHS